MGALRLLRELVQELEASLPTIERAQYWTGRRLWHAQRRYREDQHQEEWQLRQTLDAAEGLNNAVITIAQAVVSCIRLSDQIFEYQSRAQVEGFVVNRGSGVNLIYDPLGNDVSTQTPYLWPENLGGHSDRLSPEARYQEGGSSSSGLNLPDALRPVEQFSISLASNSSSAEDIADGLAEYLENGSTASCSSFSSPR